MAVGLRSLSPEKTPLLWVEVGGVNRTNAGCPLLTTSEQVTSRTDGRHPSLSALQVIKTPQSSNNLLQLPAENSPEIVSVHKAESRGWETTLLLVHLVPRGAVSRWADVAASGTHLDVDLPTHGDIVCVGSIACSCCHPCSLQSPFIKRNY
jgi:hypothetical protein